MKKSLIAAMLVAATAATSATVVAQGIAADAEGTVTIPLSGSLDRRCTIYTGETPTFTNLDLESLELQGSGSLIVSCNYTGGTRVTFTSANSGTLSNTEVAETKIDYAFVLDGSANASSNSPLQLSEPLIEDDLFNVSADLLNDPALSLDERAIQIQLLETAVIAGTYTDTITASVSPN